MAAESCTTPGVSTEEDDDDDEARSPTCATLVGASAAPSPPNRPQHSAVLAVQLGSQEQLRRLPRARLKNCWSATATASTRPPRCIRANCTP
jgi:hypothetical protein